MYYYIIAGLIIIGLAVIVYFTNKSKDDETNILEDIPPLNVSKEALQKHAFEISNFYSETKGTNSRRKIIKSLDLSYANIIKAYEYIDKNSKKYKEFVPAAEWLLDNLYLIEKEYKNIKHNMPKNYYNNLPVVNKGVVKGYPRVYHIAVELVSHSDGIISEEIIESFIASYQKNAVLNTGELWALPIMLRIALIQNISKIAQKIVFSEQEKQKGDNIADNIIEAVNENRIDEELQKLINVKMGINPHYIERMLKVLRDNGIENSNVYKWIDEKLEAEGTCAEKMINLEHQKQACFQLSIGNCITSIREIEALNWRENFQKLSYVEDVLRMDPSGLYEKMDFESRDYYRHSIERLAKCMKVAEGFIAKKAIECAQEAECNDQNEYVKHVGYYLIDDGVSILKSKIPYKGKCANLIKDNIKKHRVAYYIGTITIATLILMLSIMYSNFIKNNNPNMWKLIVAFIAILIPCSEIVISILNWNINHIARPRFMPKLDFKDGIPNTCKTVVVIPTLLNNEKRVHDLISDMEVYYLANQDKNLFFALLGDFKDSDKEKEENDEKINEFALKEISALNKKYNADGVGGADRFYFFNRYRKYNEKQGIWLGWERKRGKLVEFNSILRGNKNTSYNVISGNIKNLNDVKYVITLDADTELPIDSAKKLVGAMAHILSKPYVDMKNKAVIRGYGLMQPRISVGTISANKTMFSRIFSGETGIDVYSTAISDIYQDVFGEGIFTGKGIYDVDVFNYMLKDEISENSVLSHDLLEGSYVRTALVTDIELIDGYPAYYNSSILRLHRWVRGDWQLIPWLFKKSSLNRLSKWKIIDNLRRSLLTPSIIILIILSLSLLTNDDIWMVVAFIGLLSPMLFDVSENVVSPIKGISLSGKIDSGKRVAEQVFLIFCFLPYNAYMMVDAIIRTLYRLFISKKNLLEWQTAADVEARSGKRLADYVSSMWIGSFIAIMIDVLAFNISVNRGILMLPSCVIWIFSPYIAYYISRENKANENKLSKEQYEKIHTLTRKTWAYFEDFVSSESNWLAPDNYQEDPDNGVAFRTSPTNIGMGLSSSVVAYDMGYIGIVELVDRLDKILVNMESLQRYKGHFYNWYDTKTKEPLYPRYISTVDSGNLVGYLWLVEEALSEYQSKPIITEKMYKGLCDLLLLANEEIGKELSVKDNYTQIIKESKDVKVDIVSWKKILLNVWSKCIQIEKCKGGESLYWNNKVKHTVSKSLREIQRIFPWADVVIEGQEKHNEIVEKLKTISAKTSVTNIDNELEEIIVKLENTENNDEWLEQVQLLIANSKKEINSLILKTNDIKQRLNYIGTVTDFKILYDSKRQLFAIGYDMESDTVGNCYYDLLASEARQASFVAIAKGDIESKHWFKLGRALTLMDKSKGLVSWSGTMFEYFMPLLIMKNYPDTLLNETYKSVIEAQKKYCVDKKVPWGISESAFYGFDVNLNYQYKAFGIPGVGLKRGLSNELVISPYSTVMAMQVDIVNSYKNLTKLVDNGLEGKYGFYDAVDFTDDRMPKGKRKAIVKCFMVHHEGMSLMAFDNILNNKILQERFHRIPKVKATELLLQERVPKTIVYDREQQFETIDTNVEKHNIIVRKYTTALTEIPETHLLSNGNYSIMVTNSGSGYAKKGDITVYRWKEDVTCDNKGMFFYVKNLNSNEFWSNTYQPCRNEGENYEVTFSLDRAEFKRKDGNLSTLTEITVSTEDNAEVRRLSITNHSSSVRTIEITSYFEVTLATYSADIVHPAFGNLFISTEYNENPMCVIANRRPRAKGKETPYVMQTVAISGGEEIGVAQYETSRANFIGRGKDLENPLVMENDAPLKNTVGAVLDPIISIRVRVKINPGETCKIAYTTAVGLSREEMLELALKYREVSNINRVFELAWTQTHVEMKYLGIRSSQANLYQLMASHILFLNTLFKDRNKYIKNISKGQSALWAYGISGDLPIVLLVIRNDKDIDMVRQLLNAHEYWSVKGLKVDLIILNLESTSYVQPLQDAVRDLISSSYARDKQNKAGGVFAFGISTMSKEDINLLMAIAKLVIDSDKGSLVSQIKCSNLCVNEVNKLTVVKKEYNARSYSLQIPKLEYFNGFGGFDLENNEYDIILKNNINTPAPWINVISNGKFGFHVSEAGISYTWYKNSRENKLTTWSNDPIIDSEAEQLYLRDEITGELWSISPKPIRDDGEYLVRHGLGYSTFIHERYGIIGEMTLFVPVNDSVKICIIKLKNNTDEERKLSVTHYGRAVMGVVPEQTAQYISTYIDNNKHYMYAKNPYNEHFGNLCAYIKAVGGSETTFTGNRKEFLGRGGSVTEPKALKNKALSNTCGAGFDPCFAVNTKISIKPSKEEYVIIALGEDESLEAAEKVINKYSSLDVALKELNNTKKYWSELLGTIKVKTPDKTMDIMLNGWLMYQVISCRIWARTAFYQSGGAYGFRDQLQDVMAVGYLNPQMTKEQILYSASRQFLEGDVQHWWHPVVDSGIRTKFSDDLLWLPFVTADYIMTTGDYGILDESVGYLEDNPLDEHEDERYTISRKSEITGSIYEHCIKTIERGLNFGAHNIPLMGSGDWNDGMSTVGNKGKGESVWVGWFLYSILGSFIEICRYKKDDEKSEKYEKTREFIRENLEKNAWDGGWYRRAYFDDGTPLGSIENDECQIDSLSQSWSVISGAAKESRIKEAMEALEKHLVKEDMGIVMLLTPAFNKSWLEPGYIKGYVPGVRENGGQYTHAAVWVSIAMARMGNGNKAWKIFNMINPINHSISHLDCEKYKVEPYVMTADVYAIEPHIGRGGWSWYTGAAGWMYRAGIEEILGLKFKGENGFTIKPCIPDDWKEYEIEYTRGECKYNIVISREKDKGITLDGNKLEDSIIPFLKDGVHEVKVII